MWADEVVILVSSLMMNNLFRLFYLFIHSHQPLLNNSEQLLRRRPMSNGDAQNLFDVKYKVLLLGDTLVGKSSLQRSIAGKDFRPDIGSTIGMKTNFYLKNSN